MNLRTAAQQALEALEHDNPSGRTATITALRAALAEPVQEPVTWRWGYRSVTTGEMDWRGYVEIPSHPNLRSPAIIMEPLYTAPTRCPNCASLEAQNDELDRRLAAMECKAPPCATQDCMPAQCERCVDPEVR